MTDSLTEKFDNNDDESLISHIEALRSALIKCILAIAIVLPFAFLTAPKVLNAFTKIIAGSNNITFNYFTPMEVFLLQIKIAFLIDFIACFPYIAKNLWDFVLPALYENEKHFIKSIVLSSTILFCSGVAFCIFAILPLIMNFGMSFSNNQINAMFGISNVINLSFPHFYFILDYLILYYLKKKKKKYWIWIIHMKIGK